MLVSQCQRVELPSWAVPGTSTSAAADPASLGGPATTPRAGVGTCMAQAAFPPHFTEVSLASTTAAFLPCHRLAWQHRRDISEPNLCPQCFSQHPAAERRGERTTRHSTTARQETRGTSLLQTWTFTFAEPRRPGVCKPSTGAGSDSASQPLRWWTLRSQKTARKSSHRLHSHRRMVTCWRCLLPWHVQPTLRSLHTLPPLKPVPPRQRYSRVTHSRPEQCSAGASWRRQEAKIHHLSGLSSILQLANFSLEVHCSGDKTEHQGKSTL